MFMFYNSSIFISMMFHPKPPNPKGTLIDDPKTPKMVKNDPIYTKGTPLLHPKKLHNFRDSYA